tara:strand:- start:9730 stop:9960 length:231 start_codon:yes stop_codon:yes gene_type:complete
MPEVVSDDDSVVHRFNKPECDHVVWVQKDGKKYYLHANGCIYRDRRQATCMTGRDAERVAKLVEGHWGETGAEKYK